MNRKELLRRIFAAEQQLAGLKLRLDVERRREQAPVIEVVDQTGEGEMSDLRRTRDLVSIESGLSSEADEQDR